VSNSRTLAREYAMQALYQWQMTELRPGIIDQQFYQQQSFKGVKRSYFSELLIGVPDNLEVIDRTLTLHVDRPVKKIDPVERAILRIAVYELLHRSDVPYRVIINEAINLAKKFGAEASHKYINSVLDKVARRQRTLKQKSVQPVTSATAEHDDPADSEPDNGSGRV